MHTQKIRKQAKEVSWDLLKFCERIRPMIPCDIHEAVKKSKIHADLLRFIEVQYSISLARVIEHFCHPEDETKKSMTYGELIYYLKDLELYGLIDIIYRSLMPRVSPSFFPKAKYANNPIKWSFMAKFCHISHMTILLQASMLFLGKLFNSNFF